MKKSISLLTALLLIFFTVPTQANPRYSLTISYQKTSSAKPIIWKLNCRPASGTHPIAKLACQEIRATTSPFTRPAADEICTKIYGGDEKATVTGRWAGKQIKRTFTKTNGCEIDRWDQLSQTLTGKPRS